MCVKRSFQMCSNFSCIIYTLRWSLTDIPGVVEAVEHLLHFNRPMVVSKEWQVCKCKRTDDAEMWACQKPVGVVYVVMATHVIPTWLRHCTGESRHFCTQSTGCQMDHHSPVKEPRSWRKGWRRKICELILSERSHCRAASVSIPGRGERRIDRVQIDN